MQSKVSIIIPAFNRADLIGETLDSIINQTYTNWECIVVDDGSTDNTVEVVSEYQKKDKRIKLHPRPETKNKGANSCRNYGLDLSSGDYIQFFDSDDIMKPTCLENRVLQFQKQDVDFLVFSMGFIKKGKKYEESGYVTTVKTWQEALIKFLSPDKLPWNTIRIIFKSASIKDRIYYNEDLLRFQDIEFNIRLLINLQPTFAVVPITDCYYRIIDVNNPKPPTFYQDVFKSVPVYFNSLSDKLETKQFNQNKSYFKKWFFNLTSLYANEHVPTELFKKALKATKQNVGLGYKQIVVLNLVFRLKKYFKGAKGHSKIFDVLKSIY